MTRFRQFLTLLAVALCLGATAQSALAQTAQTQQVMREKLELAQVLLGAVVTSNWASLDKTTKALTAVTKSLGK